MKKRPLPSLFFALLSTVGTAQNQVIKINSLGLLVGITSLSYEKIINEKGATQLYVDYASFKVNRTEYDLVGIGMDYKFYPSKTKAAPRGVYVAPGLEYARVIAKTKNAALNGLSAVVIRGIFGYQWIWKSGFALDLFGGYGYYRIDAEHKGTFRVVGVAIGYGFGLTNSQKPGLEAHP